MFILTTHPFFPSSHLPLQLRLLVRDFGMFKHPTTHAAHMMAVAGDGKDPSNLFPFYKSVHEDYLFLKIASTLDRCGYSIARVTVRVALPKLCFTVLSPSLTS
jgi:hypothetical protein